MTKKNVVIFGAFVYNKGAQSMLFTVIDEIKKQNPNANIYVPIAEKASEDILNIYNFNFIDIGIKDKLNLAGGIFKLLSKVVSGPSDSVKAEQFEKVIISADLIIDISGFALSSKFSRNNTLNYLSHIRIASKYKKEMILFPQSFGPFNYNHLEKALLMRLIKQYLKYPKKIYTREKEGFDYLQSFGLKNIEMSVDTVLQKQDNFTLSNLFKHNIITKEIDIEKGSVGIIPNERTINKENKETVYNFYNKVINELLNLNKKVYLLRHSTEDLEIIKDLYQTFKNNKNVILIEEEYNAIELHSIIKQFDYIVASRYHSIVHAYKVGTPALVLGWAIKYKELLGHFNQSKYQYDIKNIDTEKFIASLNEMNEKYLEEKEIILYELMKINEKSIFADVLEHIK